MSLCGAFCNAGAEGDFNSQERAQLAYRKNLLYVHSLRELTVSAVLPGIRSLLANLRAQRIPVGLASVSLNAPTILAALELREFFTFCADASQLKTRNRTRKSFSPPVPGWACRRRHVSALKMRRRALTPLTPAVCARWGSARLNRGAITVAFNGITHLAAVIGLLAKRIAKESTWLSFRYNIFKKSTITRCMW